MLLKSTSHWLFLEHKQGETLHEIVLQIDKGDIENVVTALEARTGRSIETLTESRINPTEGSKNIREDVPYSVEQIRSAMRPVMEMYGCQITKDEDDEMVCERGRNENRPGQGCGGEKITAEFDERGAKTTRLEITTGKGFKGVACKKNWSTPIFKQVTKRLMSIEDAR